MTNQEVAPLVEALNRGMLDVSVRTKWETVVTDGVRPSIEVSYGVCGVPRGPHTQPNDPRNPRLQQSGGAEGRLLSLPGRLTAPIQRVWHDYQFKKQSLIHAGRGSRLGSKWMCGVDDGSIDR